MADIQHISSNSTYSYTSSKYWCAQCRKQFSQLSPDNSSQANCPRCDSVSNQIPQNVRRTTNNSTQANGHQSENAANTPNHDDGFMYYTQPMTDPYGRVFYRTFRVPVRDQNQRPSSQGNHVNTGRNPPRRQNNQNEDRSNQNFLSQLFGNFFGGAPAATTGFNFFGSGFASQADDTTIEEFLRNDPNQHGPPPASQEAMSQLQEVVFDNKANRLDDPCCPVCQEDYQQGEKLVRLPCNHDYHKECVNKWLLKHNSCPMCRQAI